MFGVRNLPVDRRLYYTLGTAAALKLGKTQGVTGRIAIEIMGIITSLIVIFI
jgi:putative effector of murein hydrolase